MNRLEQAVLIGSFVPLCWLAMMGVHESGHVVAAWLTGGTVTKVVLHPLAISRTDVAPNPHPLAVAWAGPVGGALLPLVIWITSASLRAPGADLLRFFAGFCLIANGAYIGIGSMSDVGDAGDMLRHGSPIWLLWLFGGLSMPLGLRLWHGLGPRFGLGESAGRVDRRAVCVSLILFLAAVIAAAVLSPRS